VLTRIYFQFIGICPHPVAHPFPALCVTGFSPIGMSRVSPSKSSGRMIEHPSPTQFRAGHGEPLPMVRLATICSDVFCR
jgi:hypothetical protein